MFSEELLGEVKEIWQAFLPHKFLREVAKTFAKWLMTSLP